MLKTNCNNNSHKRINKKHIITTNWFLCSLVVLIILLFSSGCAKKIEQEEGNPVSILEQEKTNWSEQFENHHNIGEEPRFQEKPKQPKPRFKALNPLDTERLSLSMVEQNYTQVLQILAHTAALNLIISPQTTAVLGDFNLLTIEFQEMTVREILDSVSKMLDVAWYEENGSLFIEPFISKKIDLDFLGSIRQSSFEVGGDVLGATGGGEGSSPLAGSFVIQGGTTDAVTDIYTNIEASIARLLGSGGGAAATGAGDGAAAGGSAGNSNSFFVLNRQTGHLLVRSRPGTVAEIENFIHLLREKYRRQVLIEAKIIEVGLNQKHALGIDWRSVNAFVSRTALRNASAITGAVAPVFTGSDSFYTLAMNLEHANINAIFRALEEYGELSVLSNPRLKAMNGQSSIISVGQSVAYLASVEREVEDERISYTTETGSVFDGVLLGITPIIEQGGVITLHIVPIKSDLIKLETVSLGQDATQITLPRVNLREMSTVARVRSGDIVLLGGLIMESRDNDETGLPGLGNIPLVGRLFKYETNVKKRVELVVALQVKVIENY